MGSILKFKRIAPELPVLFTHVPKTGGSTITRGMAAMLGPEKTAGISSAPHEQRRDFLTSCRAAGTPYVYGHFRYGDAAAVYDEANYIVSLRHPLDRILSFYFMLLRAKSDFALECAKDLSGAGFVMFHDRLVRRRQQDNLICRYLCGEPDHKQAIEILQGRYSLAWSTEGVDLAWRELCRSLKGQCAPSAALAPRNVAPFASNVNDLASGGRPKDYSTFLPRENIALVEEVNREDVLLFEWFSKIAEPDRKQVGTAETASAGAKPESSGVATAEDCVGHA